MKKILDNLKYIKLKDLLSPFALILCLPVALCFRLINKVKKRKLWLICERYNTASDNGYHFFKYIREKHPDDYCFYVIDKKSKEYEKIKDYGNVLQWGSFKHWIYYLSAEYNISTQKNGNPANALFYIIHVSMGLYKNRVFLQHGITKDDNKYFYYKEAKFKYVICGAKEEYEFIKERFGYPEGSVLYTGFSRFDNLIDFEVNKNQILVMPTWRNWLGRDVNSLAKQEDFLETEFYKNWNELLSNKRLNDYLSSKGIKISFYPHYYMQKFLSYFNIESNNIELLDVNNSDIQELLRTSALMVTDYSSVQMDFAYMRKPVIYYHFDYEEYRSKQIAEGYFDCNTFGKVCKNCDEVVDKIISYIDSDYNLESDYLNNMNNFFELHDKENCKRIYDSLKQS